MSGRFQCCGFSLGLLSWLDHLQAHHATSAVVECVECSAMIDFALIRSHVINEHLFPCPQPGCEFFSCSFEDAERHWQSHAGQPPPPRPAAVCGRAEPSVYLIPPTQPTAICGRVEPSVYLIPPQWQAARPGPSVYPIPSPRLPAPSIVAHPSGEALDEGETSRQIRLLLQSQPNVKSVHMARHLVFHPIGPDDRGYGCGYRNLQTVIASMLFDPQMRTAMQINRTPQIEDIQADIEFAWRCGFDAQGAAQLGHRLLRTRKWIGATEIAAYLQFHRIRIQLIDAKMSGDKRAAQMRLINWVFRYFTQSNCIFPLYFQHHGHSRTIIGVEENSAGRSLLIFDPGKNLQWIEEALRTRSPKRLNFLRHPPSALIHAEYQIVAVRGVLEADFCDLAKTFNEFNHLEL